MKPNTYVKIVSSGIANPVEELLPFIQGEEIMPLQEDESVEVRSSVFNEGNIIIFRNRKSRDVLSVIHTPHTVYIQEQNKTISTHRPFSSILFGAGDNGTMEPAAPLFKINLPGVFYVTASEELCEIAAYITSVLEQLNSSIINAAIEFDRFNLPCRKNVGLEPAFGYLNEALERTLGMNLLPVKGPNGNPRNSIDYFYLEYVNFEIELGEVITKVSTDDKGEIRTEGKILFSNDQGSLGLKNKCSQDYPNPKHEDPSAWLIDPDTKLPVDPSSPRGIELHQGCPKTRDRDSIISPADNKIFLDEPPKVDLTRAGQQGN